MKIIFKKKCEKLMKNMLGIETTKRVPKIYVYSKDNKKGAKEAKDTTIL